MFTEIIAIFAFQSKPIHAFQSKPIHAFQSKLIQMNQTMYHTQENRGYILDKPMLCCRKDAWLGTAYYFWWDVSDAMRWGTDSKNDKFQIYSARIESDKVLDTVFNQEHYNFFIKSIERVATQIAKKTGTKLSKEHLCEYLNERAKWKDEIDVILINDNPQGTRETIPIPVRKRIQAAVYNDNCIKDFKFVDSYG